MGRKRKYFTDKEKRDAHRQWQMDHYERNKDALRKVARDRYRKKRREEIEEVRRKQLYGE